MARERGAQWLGKRGGYEVARKTETKCSNLTDDRRGCGGEVSLINVNNALWLTLVLIFINPR